MCKSKKETGYILTCLKCKSKFSICVFCYRGQSYCSDHCRSLSRLEKQKFSAKRYRQTRRAKFLQARRQTRYRLNQKKNVTHQSSNRSSNKLKTNRQFFNSFQNLKKTNLKECHICTTKITWFVPYPRDRAP